MGTPEKRFKEHIADSKRDRYANRPLYKAFQKYGPENFTVEAVEECEPEELSEKEKYWIQYYGTFHYGYNATTGGDGSPFIDYDLVVKNYKELGTCTDVAKVMDISVYSVRDILKIKNVEIAKNQPNSASWKATPVIAYTKEGEPVKSFVSKHDAAKWLFGQGKTKYTVSKKDTRKGIVGHISACCKGQRKTAYGYVWKEL